MTDRELLEMAAKATGVKVEGYGNNGIAQSRNGPVLIDYWNPIRDDGDALRLAVKLRMSIHYEIQRFDGQDVEIVEVHHSHNDDLGRCQCVAMTTGEDAGAATRRAIVRAAAEIGRSAG